MKINISFIFYIFLTNSLFSLENNSLSESRSYSLIYSHQTLNLLLRESPDNNNFIKDQWFHDKKNMYKNVYKWYEFSREKIKDGRRNCDIIFDFIIQNSIHPLNKREKRALLVNLFGQNLIKKNDLKLFFLKHFFNNFLLQTVTSTENFTNYTNKFCELLTLITIENENNDQALFNRYILELFYDDFFLNLHTYLNENNNSLIEEDEGSYFFNQHMASLAAEKKSILMFYQKGTELDALQAHLYLLVHGQNIHLLFSDGGLNQIIKQSLNPFTHTSHGKKSLMIHCLNPIDKNHAKNTITSRQSIITLLQKNSEGHNEIVSLLKEISAIEKQQSSLDIQDIEKNLARFIPPHFLGGYNASKGSYAMYSLFVQWQSSLFLMIKNSFLATCMINPLPPCVDTHQKSPIFVSDNQHNSILKNPLTALALPPLWKITKTLSKEYYESGRPFTYGDYIDFEERLSGFKVHHENDHGFKHVLNTLKGAAAHSASFVNFSFDFLSDTYNWYSTYKNIFEQIKIMQKICEYLRLGSKKITLCKKLCSKIKEICSSEEISFNSMPHEIRYFENLVNKEQKDFNNFIQSFSEWENSSLKNITIGTLIPGKIAHFYFKIIKNNRLFEIFDSFIGEIDAACTKFAVLEQNKSHENKFCVTSFKWESSEPFLILEKLWNPKVTTPISNSFRLNKDSKNILLVAPYGGGKTIALGSILIALYLSFSGIAPASEAFMTYFDSIIDYTLIGSGYDRGGGTSSHMAEQIKIKELKEIIQSKDTLSIVFIDEIYARTSPQDAIQSASEDLPGILTNPHCISIISTHHNSLVEFANKDMRTDLYYLDITETNEGNFYKKFTIHKDQNKTSPENWWHNDAEKRMRYRKWSNYQYN